MPNRGGQARNLGAEFRLETATEVSDESGLAEDQRGARMGREWGVKLANHGRLAEKA
ncbi:hypothetical protein HPC62_07450 [Thermoleptolyngbya sichuanensis A183]|uniref:Uncharacterized protein n=1 Tax=Thermoleptolyngbya sichuanensis A183 TaxID=2737172 RepID=A0A6M8BD12_9CYAN|nr:MULTISPECIES: hypothetical protein [Thermoleptolyngbya]QKD82056.1 hypothetical protein HPC62_07450 [Thermoleptolyngbya sichuanensis A183]